MKPAEVVAVAIEAMAKETAGSEKAKNTVVLGLMAGWFGLAPEHIRAGLRKRFAKKGEEIMARNERAFEAGLAWAKDAPAAHRAARSRPCRAAPAPKMVADGNDLCAAAAIFAGCQFFGGYPITPVVGDHAVPQPRDLEVRRRRCCSARTRLPASARASARASPARRR